MVLAPFVISFLIAVATTPLVIFLYKKFGWIDDPKKNLHAKVLHDEPVPRGGGIVIFLAISVATLLTVPLSLQMVMILLGMSILTLVGIFDDVFDISPYIRILTGVIVAFAVISSGIGIDFVTNPFGDGVIMLNQLQFSFMFFGIPLTYSILADAFALIWIVWNMNIVNWSKGLDGQLPGVVGIASICIGILAMRFSMDPQQLGVIVLSFAVAGAYFGFLVWNKYPQKIMPGYGAGSIGGYFLAVLSIMSGAKLATALLVLGIPTADAVFTILRRVKKKKSPFWGDRGHLHHKLYDVFGWSKPQIAGFYWFTTALLGVIALQLQPGQKLFTILLITSLVFGFLIWVKLFFTSSNRPDRDSG